MPKSFRCPTFFLRTQVLLPGSTARVFIGREKSISAVRAAQQNAELVFAVLQKDPECEDPEPGDIFEMGILGSVLQAPILPDGTLKLILECRYFGKRSSCVLDGDHWVSSVSLISKANKAKIGRKIKTDFLSLVRRHSESYERAVIAQLNTIQDKQLAKKAITKFAGKHSSLNFKHDKRLIFKPVFVDQNNSPTIVFNLNQTPLGSAIMKGTTSTDLHEPQTPARKTITVKSPKAKSKITVAINDAIARAIGPTPILTAPLKPPDEDAALKADAAFIDLLADTISQIPTSNTLKQQLLADGNSKNITRAVSDLIRHEIRILDATDKTADARLPQIFICHSSADKQRIKPILLGLIGAGFRLFIDRPNELGLATHPHVSGIKSGPFRNEISNALRESSCVLTLWSVDAARHHKTEMLEEASIGKDRGILVQGAIEEFRSVYERLPLGFKEWQLLDLNPLLVDQSENLPADISLLSREINDIVRRHPNTKAPLEPWRQDSAAVAMAVVQQQLRTFPKPPPPVSRTKYTSLEDLRRLFVARTRKLADRLSQSNHPMERDIADVLHDILRTFDRQLDEIDLAVAPSLGELLGVLCETYKDQALRQELSPHVFPALKLAAAGYEQFAEQWNAWADQRSDRAREWVTPENADRTREAADVVIEFARSASIVHRSVPDVLTALRQLIKPALSFSQFNEYRYLNAIGEGLRACWNEGERYISDHWNEIQASLSAGGSPVVGPFNAFILELSETLIQLSKANTALFGWLFVRVGYLKRLVSGDLLNLDPSSI